MKRALFALAVLATLALVVATVLAVLERRKEDARRRAEEERSATTLERLRRLKELIDARGATCETYPPLAAGDRGDSDGQQALGFAIQEMLASDSAVLADAWGRPIQFRRPGPVHKDGWDIYSLGADGKGTDRSLYLGEHYVPPPRDARVDELYAKETRERLEALRLEVAKLTRKPESTELKDLLEALKLEGLEARRAHFMDLWGHNLRWACPGRVHTKGWDLYSIGPNGDDEEGAGDDIVTGEDTR